MATWRGLSAVLSALALGACSYDFDHFAKGAGGSANVGGQGGSQAGTGGTATGGVAGASGGSTSVGGGGTSAIGGGGAGGTSSGTGGVGGSTGACASGQTEWNGHCYFAGATGTGVGWTAASAACAASGNAHLVTIGSTEEQAMLAQTFFPSVADFWIGLSLADPSLPPPASCITTPSSCPFVWVTGESLAYTNWATYGEPNYSGSCVRMRADTQQWADYGCATMLGAICEID